MFHELQQLRGVVKLAQVDAMSHRLAIGHDAHLQSTHRHVILHQMSFLFLFFPPSRPRLLLPSLSRMWSRLMGLMWHHVLYTVGRGLQQPWKMWLTTAGLLGDKTFQCFPLETSTSLTSQISVTITETDRGFKQRSKSTEIRSRWNLVELKSL